MKTKSRYKYVEGILCRMLDPEPMTLETQFPCLVRMKNIDLNRWFHYWSVFFGESAIAVGYHSNQDPDRHLNCYQMKAGFQGYFYGGFEVIGYPIIDPRNNNRYIRK